MKVVKGDKTVSYLPRKFSGIAWYFLARGGEISVKEIGRRQCGGMEVPCQLSLVLTRDASTSISISIKDAYALVRTATT